MRIVVLGANWLDRQGGSWNKAWRAATPSLPMCVDRTISNLDPGLEVVGGTLETSTP